MNLSRHFASAVLALGLLSASAGAQSFGDKPWQVLPPMPELPTATRSGPVAVGDIQMWRAEFGPDTGKPVVMVHGGLANSSYWGAVIPYLTQAGYHVICVDSRGHGRSTRSEKPYSYELMAGDVVGMLDALKIPKADLIGWSDGGIIGIVMAIHNPEHLRRVFAFGANTVPSGLRGDFEKSTVFNAYVARSEAEYDSMSPTKGQHGAFVKQISEMWATQPNITDAQLSKITTPITIADGRYDEGIRQSHNSYMAGAIPAARLVILPGVSHFAMLQNPALFARASLDALEGSFEDDFAN